MDPNPTALTPAPPTLDPVATARWARQTLPASPWLHEEVGRRMAQRLAWIKTQPQTWCDWEPQRGGVQAHALVQQHYPKAPCYVVQTQAQQAQAMQRVLGRRWWRPADWGAPALQVQNPAPGAVQMLWANMALHLTASPQALLAQWHQALATDGFLMFSCLGPDTARELRRLYQQLGWGPMGQDFTDMHDWGDMLVQSGFAEPVMDMERIVLTYNSPAGLLDELRSLGRNFHPQRFSGLRGRGWRKLLEQAVAAHLAPSGSPGSLALTFEIIYGHAIKPLVRVPVQAQSSLSLEQMRETLARNRRLSG